MRTLLASSLVLAFSFVVLPAQAAEFTYRGELEKDGLPHAGLIDLRLSLYADGAKGMPLAGPLELFDVAVSEGRFAVATDFGDLPLLLNEAWLQVEVRGDADPTWWALPSREPVGLKGGTCPDAWGLAGNAGTNPASNFLGTTDANAFELRTRNARSLRIEPSSVLHEGLPNTASVIGGSHVNRTDPGVRGATIAGGGLPPGESDPDLVREGPNEAMGHFAAIGGGYNNSAGEMAVVGGGQANYADGVLSSIAGGLLNEARGQAAAVCGGQMNNAAQQGSSVIGGLGNSAAGFAATVAGGESNCAGGRYSWAAGHGAKVRPGTSSGDLRPGCQGLQVVGTHGDEGSFVWADHQANDYVTRGPGQFLVRAGGSVQFAHDSAVQTNVGAWFSVRGPGDRAPFVVRNGNTNGLHVTSSNGVVVGDTATAPPANGLLVLGAARRMDNLSTWTTTSDARVKRDIVPLQNALETLLQLRPSRFRYTADYLAERGGEDREHLGFVAQELRDVLPDAVSVESEGEGGSDLLAVNLSDAYVLTIAATRELALRQGSVDTELAALRRSAQQRDTQLAALEQENKLLRERFAQLEGEHAERIALIEARLQLPSPMALAAGGE